MNRSAEIGTCPDWAALDVARDDGAAGEAAWMDALEHRSECAACHQAALDVDPTLMFLDMPPVETSEAEIAAMQERVAISRRFSESVAETETEAPESRPVARWLAAAAALIFVGVAGLNQPVTEPSDAVQASLPAAGEAASSSLAEHLEALPLVEGGDVRYEVSGGSADYAVLVYTGVDL